MAPVSQVARTSVPIDNAVERRPCPCLVVYRLYIDHLQFRSYCHSQDAWATNGIYDERFVVASQSGSWTNVANKCNIQFSQATIICGKFLRQYFSGNSGRFLSSDKRIFGNSSLQVVFLQYFSWSFLLCTLCMLFNEIRNVLTTSFMLSNVMHCWKLELTAFAQIQYKACKRRERNLLLVIIRASLLVTIETSTADWLLERTENGRRK
jgi:hypothetical protein